MYFTQELHDGDSVVVTQHGFDRAVVVTATDDGLTASFTKLLTEEEADDEDRPTERWERVDDDG